MYMEMKVQSIYLNANEGDATVSISWRDIFGDSQYIGLELDYGTHEDHFQVEIMSGGSAAGEGLIGPIEPENFSRRVMVQELERFIHY